jgi:peptidoglycan/LPS O-acetylase OafA/YrhL
MTSRLARSGSTIISSPIDTVDSSTGHIRALDGVRGLAILMVMVGHFWLGAHPQNAFESGLYTVLQNGWIGVDLFFVLSGFLITGILLDAKGADGYFRNFYARRVLRIFPLYYGFLFAFFILAPRLMNPAAGGPFAESSGSQIWFWTYASNYLSLVKGAELPQGLNHFWTLAVEEQFYLIWPAIVFVTSRATLKKLCLSLIVAAFAFRLGLRLTDYYHTGGLVLTPARIDTLALGGWLAAMVREQRTRDWVGRIAPGAFIVAAVALLVLNLPDERLFGYDIEMQSFGFPLLALMSASLIVLTTSTIHRAGRVRRAFDSRPLGFFGKYSYGMYVLHLPLVVALERAGFGISSFPRVANSDVPGAIAYTLIAITLTALLAFASWHLYEKQFLKLKRFFPLPSSGDGGLARLQNVDDPGGGDGRGPRWSQLELEPVVAARNEGEVENH